MIEPLPHPDTLATPACRTGRHPLCDGIAGTGTLAPGFPGHTPPNPITLRCECYCHRRIPR